MKYACRSLLAFPLAAAIACAGLASCGRAGASAGVVRIVPSAPGGAAAVSASTSVVTARSAPEAGPRPHITLDPADTVLSVININLDQDADEEQVIAVKRVDEIGSAVRVLVVDVDPTRGTYYYQSWAADTNAADSRVFSLSAQDVVGDHSAQIVVNGMNDRGELTLDLFHPAPAVRGKGLAYRPICQIVADEISLQETERPESYSAEGSPGASFPVIVYLRDPNSENVMDLVRIRYSWSATESRYVPGAAEKIPANEAQQAQLKTLFTSSGADAFIRFLSGSWVQVVHPANAKGTDTYGAVIDFDADNRKISLASGNTQEVYIWKESHRTIYNRILAIGENETVLQIRLILTFAVTVDSPTEITVTVIGNDAGETPTSVYSKVTDDIRSRLLHRSEAQVQLSNLMLSGKYTGTQGISLDFDPPRLTWTNPSGSREASYVIFRLGTRTMISLRFRSAGRSADRITTWLLDYRETKDAARPLNTLSLSPVVLTVNGYEDASGDTLTLQQAQELKPQ